MRVGYIKDSFEGAAFERQTETVTDQTPGSVASYDIPPCDCPNWIVAGFDLGGDAIAILGETLEFRLPQHLLPMASQILVEKPLRFALLQHQDEGEGTHPFSHVAKLEL